MTGVVVLVLLMATAVFVFLRGRRGTMSARSKGASVKDRNAAWGDASLTTGGPISGAAFGGFGGARRGSD